jgi:hypothetical protein
MMTDLSDARVSESPTTPGVDSASPPRPVGLFVFSGLLLALSLGAGIYLQYAVHPCYMASAALEARGQDMFSIEDVLDVTNGEESHDVLSQPCIRVGPKMRQALLALPEVEALPWVRADPSTAATRLRHCIDAHVADPDGTILRFSVKSSDPESAVVLANGLSHVYEEKVAEAFRDRWQEYMDELVSLKRDLQKRQTEIQAEIEDVSQREELVTYWLRSPQLTRLRARRDALNEARDHATDARKKLLAQEQADGAGPAPSETLDAIDRHIAKLTIETDLIQGQIDDIQAIVRQTCETLAEFDALHDEQRFGEDLIAGLNDSIASLEPLADQPMIFEHSPATKAEEHYPGWRAWGLRAALLAGVVALLGLGFAIVLCFVPLWKEVDEPEVLDRKG